MCGNGAALSLRVFGIVSGVRQEVLLKAVSVVTPTDARTSAVIAPNFNLPAVLFPMNRSFLNLLQGSDGSPRIDIATGLPPS